MPLGDVLIEVTDVAKHFGEGPTRVDALRSVDLTVRAGEVIALLGPSGSGKTTLLNIIGCILAPSSGKVVLDGEPVFDGKWLRRDLRRLRLDKIGFIFQSHNLLPFLTAEENVAVVLDLAGWPADKGRARARELLEYLEVGHRAPAKPALEAGLRAYERIARLAAPLVAPGGYLILCSCSHAADLSSFRNASARGIGRAGRRGQILHTGFAGPDHPLLPQLAESGYLKSLVFRLD